MSLSEVAIFLLGASVAYMAMTFIARLGAYTVASFVAFLAAIFSGVALTFVTENIKQAGGEANDVWLYPIGFAAGLILWTVLRIVLRLTVGLNQFGDDSIFTPPRNPAGGETPE